ncbi:MAG: ABC transporter permease, partial [Actinomycetota bacterium]
MTTLLVSRWLIDYSRRPLNLALLVVVPVVFVVLSAGALADFSEILGGAAAVGEVEAATAGWAAAVLSGVAGFFHVSTSRDADRRLAAAGVGTATVVVSRLISTLALSTLAAIGALAALAARTDLATTPRVIGATLVFAAIYAGIGAAVGAIVHSELNGSLIVVFAWIFDVFFGPAMGGVATVLRLFPLHFPTLVITDIASGHSGQLGDLGLSLLWAGLTLSVGTLSLVRTTRPHPTTRRRSPTGQRLGAALTAAARQLGRMPVVWILIIALPVLFISTSIVDEFDRGGVGGGDDD